MQELRHREAKGAERVRGAQEKRVDPEASAATTHNWKAVLKTGNTMKDDDGICLHKRGCTPVPKTTIIT